MVKREPSPVSVLLGAAQSVERHGLARGCFADDDGAICVVTALVQQVVPPPFLIPWWENVGTPAPAVYIEAVAALNAHLGWPAYEAIERAEEQLMAWNDGGATGAGEVAETLRQAAHYLREFLAVVRNG